MNNLLQLCKNKKTTVDDVLNEIKQSIDLFQGKTQDKYIEKYKSEIRSAKDYEKISKKIAELVYSDTQEFVENYVTKGCDDILDAINTKQIKKDYGHSILVILTATKTVFED
jgi:hypothetical protein